MLVSHQYFLKNWDVLPDVLAVHQCGETRQSYGYGRALAGWPQLFARRSVPKWWKIALKIGVLSANLKNGGVAGFLAAKPGVLLQNSGLGLKVTQAW